MKCFILSSIYLFSLSLWLRKNLFNSVCETPHLGIILPIQSFTMVEENFYLHFSISKKGVCVNGVYLNEKDTDINGKGTSLNLNGSSLNIQDQQHTREHK